jgi:hypothetical protein
VSGGRKIQPGQQQHSRPGQTNHPFHEISLGLGGRNYGDSMCNCKHKNYGLAGILRTAWFNRATTAPEYSSATGFVSTGNGQSHGFYNAYTAYNPPPSSSISFWPLPVLTVRLLKDLIPGVTLTFSPCALCCSRSKTASSGRN